MITLNILTMVYQGRVEGAEAFTTEAEAEEALRDYVGDFHPEYADAYLAGQDEETEESDFDGTKIFLQYLNIPEGEKA